MTHHLDPQEPPRARGESDPAARPRPAQAANSTPEEALGAPIVVGALLLGGTLLGAALMGKLLSGGGE